MLTRIIGPLQGYYATIANIPIGEFGERHLGMYRLYDREPEDAFDLDRIADGTTSEPRASRRQALDDAEDAAVAAIAALHTPGPACASASRVLHAVAYVSTVARVPSADELLDLLGAARQRNARYGVTGMLLYDDGQFMQYFEGPPPHVELIYRIIRKDPLHHGVVELTRKPVPARLFRDWSMGFQAGPGDLWVGQKVEPILASLSECAPKRMLVDFLER